MSSKGKVGTRGREITRTLWGPDGRPETEEYREACYERGLPTMLVPAPRLPAKEKKHPDQT
jgi:hypothetical protein